MLLPPVLGPGRVRGRVADRGIEPADGILRRPTEADELEQGGLNHVLGATAPLPGEKRQGRRVPVDQLAEGYGFHRGNDAGEEKAFQKSEYIKR